jgi:hypothetical protein
MNHQSPAGPLRTRLSSARPPCCRTRNPQWESVLILGKAKQRMQSRGAVGSEQVEDAVRNEPEAWWARMQGLPLS